MDCLARNALSNLDSNLGSRIHKSQFLGRPAFNLLELVIVLALMSGMLAIAWPNVRRAMASSELSDCAAKLGGLFQEIRDQAVRNGQCWMARLDSASGRVLWGPANQVMDGRPPLAERDAKTPARIHLLPESIRIESVCRSARQAGQGLEGLSADPRGASGGEWQADSKPWIIPFSATGFTADCYIHLRDLHSGNSKWLYLRGATGRIEPMP